MNLQNNSSISCNKQPKDLVVSVNTFPLFVPVVFLSNKFSNCEWLLRGLLPSYKCKRLENCNCLAKQCLSVLVIWKHKQDDAIIGLSFRSIPQCFSTSSRNTSHLLYDRRFRTIHSGIGADLFPIDYYFQTMK